ncbi:hypothetical protein [Mycolicibacterium smegmatis]|uniref:Uncharacterized protein n=2 Tax=Mycolicibacterium smegmatis (strain ATCC 700084 / mc(2)155) TaxID=246196 RepID=A0QWR6_MYCS2|nr:hypothetical protein [Mycolicibacterium smegmatis]ABK76217.1 hypothetical protein MSMEG_3038 [Mycolicibacterium smegmatis MC2 155]AFP39428.1 hypothetical protein MSMEI_2964 [Mycolicibacterium smegmatis MC2 155]AIU08195.1 hypothetical protein LJ00_15120 [Mycolicibacterium smegmatis MC2 155]AIU14820.1 hypothetical protein LI99_15125 [Mycolicibacterium smegmatis]AIU21443.1 hypothetical protein LI98_15130 [Mycolicibacterium smegmatis]
MTEAREQALRVLPLPYSLALRLRDAGVAPDVVSEYLSIDESALEGFYRIAEQKLAAALPAPGTGPVASDDRTGGRSGQV